MAIISGFFIIINKNEIAFKIKMKLQKIKRVFCALFRLALLRPSALEGVSLEAVRGIFGLLFITRVVGRQTASLAAQLRLYRADRALFATDRRPTCGE